MNYRPRIPSIALAALLLAAPVACSSSSSSEVDDQAVAEPAAPTAQEYFLQGNEALDAGNWSQAIGHYEEAARLDDQRWDAHMNRAIALTKAEQFDEAVQAFADALAAGGETEPVIYFNLGNLYQERTLHESAIDAYRTSMAHRGGLHYDTLLNLSASLTFLNAHEEAKVTIEEAIKLNPDDPRGHSTLALTIFSMGQPDEALAAYDEIVAMHPDYAPAHYNRAYVQLRRGEHALAQQGFQHYLDLAPEGAYVRKAQSHLNMLESRDD